MAKFPDFLEPFRQEAETFFAKGCVKDVEFSGSTYQVQVYDPTTKQDAWAFIQLDSKGRVKDSFCSCEAEENSTTCVHVAVAYLRIYQEEIPLHLRYQQSLWNQICRLYGERLGCDIQNLQVLSGGQWRIPSASGKTVFYAKGKNKAGTAFLKQIFEHRRRETEETSLKFSNLSQEEILRWREGRPSSQLMYELSFWTDLAKKMILAQDAGQDYQIAFEYSPQKIPNQVSISFRDIEIGFYLSEANLPLLIPSLATVKAPLEVHNKYEDAIEKITYHKEEGILSIQAKAIDSPKNKKSSSQSKMGIPIGNWLFVPEDGFYAKEQHRLLDSPEIKGEHISALLNENCRIIEKFLEGCSLHEDPIKVSYDISFDKKWNLHIRCFVLEKGDLTTPYSRSFGEWVYLDDDGFYRVEEVNFDEPDLTIPSSKVGDFVMQHRSWLNSQIGFQTHSVRIENQLKYTLEKDHCLRFEAHLDISSESDEHKDFGAWIYVVGQGFFSKSGSPLLLPVRPGVMIEPHVIPLFIKMNRDELHLIPHFFSEKCPIEKPGLRITLGKDQLIHVHPHYEPLPQYEDVSLSFFDEFVYIPDEGFYELPKEMQLPEAFQHSVQVEKDGMNFFIEYELENLRKYIAFLDPHLCRPNHLELLAESIEEDSKLGKGWDDMKMSYQSEFGKVPVAKLWQLISKKQRFALTDAGLIDLDDDRFHWLRQIHKDRFDTKHNVVKLNTMEVLRLDAFDEIQTPKSHSATTQHTRDLLKSLREFITPDKPNLQGLDSHLRPYQEIGVNWLWFLYHHHLSGLLCDDMGLGKTHQAMALMAAIFNAKKAEVNREDAPQPLHFLVICPTSVIYHWQDKLKAFLPGARVCTFHGMNRSLGDFHREYDILLTSYGIWRNDNELLSKVSFEVAILDEIQVAKNYNSQVYAALLNIKSKMRIGLTGTPIENHLRELKSLFDIVLPFYMPPDSEYKQFFVKPIEKQQDARRKKLLSRFIKPFVVRRKKEEVLDDLPEKTEEIAHCTLLPEQQALYHQVLTQTRERLLDELRDDHTPVPYIHIFVLLSSLKQICDHPAVYHKKPQDYKKFQSGKWDLFVELLNEARESQQKVVIFSQYLYMLDIMEDYLKEREIGYATIRGATVNRGEQVHLFNENPTCEVFLGSLQAAGLGIDLTAGSVVIHYDRWWNAARENQATDRVHRIGQKRGVQVFKLVTKGTFEERINELIEQKGKLMEEVVGVDEMNFVKQFDRREIIKLLQDVDVGKEEVYEQVSDAD